MQHRRNVQHPGLQQLLAAEGQQLACQRCSPVHRAVHFDGIGVERNTGEEAHRDNKPGQQAQHQQALIPYPPRRDDQEPGNVVRVGLLQAVHVGQILVCNHGQRDGGDVQLGALDQVQQEIQRQVNRELEGRTLQVEAASPTIRNNVIRYSPGFAIDARFFSWATIDHNVIYNNSGGIRTSAAWYNEPGFATIVNNTIVDNFGTSGIYNASETFPASNNLVYRNYNGITATTSRAGGYNLIYGSYYRDWFQRAPGEVYAKVSLGEYRLDG